MREPIKTDDRDLYEKIRKTLKSKINKKIEVECISQLHLEKKTGILQCNISRILKNGSIKQLTRIADAIGIDSI